jgi:hypothetical protein
LKTFGSLRLEKRRWYIEVEPHVAIRAKRVFAGVSKDSDTGVLDVADTVPNCRDLLWFLDRYPLEVEPGRMARLKERAAMQVERESLIDELLRGVGESKTFELTSPPRGYQRKAAELALASRGTLVGDELGVGKTHIGLCWLTDPRTRPALVVCPTHLQRQWAEKIAEFAPQLTTHILKQGTPYDYVTKRQKKGLKLPIASSHPDVLITSYAKLVGWSSDLSRVIRGVIFEEAHELRSGPIRGAGENKKGSEKGTACQEIANAALFRLGLSVGPESYLELRGGPFGVAWTGAIEAAWELLSGASSPPVIRGGYELLPAAGVEARGWTGTGFGWKQVRTFIRHACEKPTRILRAGGVSLLVTDDHSVFCATKDALESVPSDSLLPQEVLVADNGVSWDGAAEPLIDALPLARGMLRPQVVLDLAGRSRREFGLTAWQWQNMHKEAVHGPRMPLALYEQFATVLPEPTSVYLGGGRGPRLPFKVRLSDWAYVLGFFVGDGWVTRDRVNFAVDPPRIQSFCDALRNLGIGLDPKIRKMRGKSVEIRCSHRLWAKLLGTFFGGVKCHEKRIPSAWLITWPDAARRELLRGLMDSDGHLAQRDRQRVRAHYSTTSYKLALDVHALVRSLGGMASIHRRQPSIGGTVRGRPIIGRRPSYQVHWSPHAVNGDFTGRKGPPVRYRWTSGKLHEAPLRSARPCAAPAHVFDLEMVGHPSFTANGLLVHNSATPILNYGGEIYWVMQCTRPWELGTVEEFRKEWCAGGGDKSRLEDPVAFSSFLKSQGMFIRRSRKDVGREIPQLTTVVEHIDADAEALSAVESSATELARIILNRDGATLARGEQMRAGGELDWRMRQATGLAKAGHVVTFVKMLLESEHRLLLAGWHRAVFDVWLEGLKEYNPVLFTGTESERQKAESKKAFCEGDSRVMIMSLRSGAGLDGLQYSGCKTVVHGELDWAWGIHLQLTGRIHRDGQPDPVLSLFLVSDSGSDPIVADVLDIKRQQLEGLIDPFGDAAPEEPSNELKVARMRRFAEELLRRRGSATIGLAEDTLRKNGQDDRRKSA